MKINLPDMPKLESPFIRENIKGNYVCIPTINEDYRWVFEDSIAVEKLDGTNVSLWILNGRPKAIKNRDTEIDLWGKNGRRFYEGIVTAIERGYISPSVCEDGGYYGELIGDKVQANPYKLENRIWLPFSYLVRKNEYKFWQNFLKELKELSNKQIYEKVSELFKGLWSPYKRQRRFEEKPESVDENCKFEGLAAEGIVFYSRDLKMMCKLRRDMFDWFKGVRHDLCK